MSSVFSFTFSFVIRKGRGRPRPFLLACGWGALINAPGKIAAFASLSQTTHTHPWMVLGKLIPVKTILLQKAAVRPRQEGFFCCGNFSSIFLGLGRKQQGLHHGGGNAVFIKPVELLKQLYADNAIGIEAVGHAVIFPVIAQGQ